jgi:hypothetical protein
MVLPRVNNLDIGDFETAFCVETRAAGYAGEQASLRSMVSPGQRGGSR